MENKEYHIRFIISTKAGNVLGKDLQKVILEAFSDSATPDICFTEYQQHGFELAKEWADRWGEDGLVYIAGGDGSMNEVATALIGGKTPMGVLPLGTGNDFTKTLYPWAKTKAERYLKEIISKTANPRVEFVDMIRVNEHYSLNVISMGHDTVVLKKTYDLLKKYPNFKKYAYYLAVVLTVFKKKNYPIRFAFETENGEMFEGAFPVAVSVVCNGKYYGSGFNPAPMAEIDDGLADLIFAENLNVFQFIRLVLKYRKGKHFGSKKMYYARITKGWLESTNGKKFLANYDGEILETDRLEFELLPKVLPLAFLDE